MLSELLSTFSASDLIVYTALLITLFFIVDSIFLNVTGVKEFFQNLFTIKIKLTDELEKEIKTYLKEIHYYNHLSESGKERFIHRILFIIPRLEFSSSPYFNVTFRNQVLIASSIAQITFGMKNYYIHTISHIRIFKDQIMNPRTKQRFYGLMFMSGKMYLSWDKFEKGIQVNNDGINLGIHETTHGLLILLKHHKLNFDEFDSLISSWYRKAKPHIVSKDNENGFFRKYASANKDEFFSILIENFFERPAEMKQLMPDLYDEVCVFLYQDPCNISNDYRISGKQLNIAEGLTSSEVRPLNLVKDKWNWTFTALILGSYFAYIFNLIIKNFLASSFIEIFYTYLICFPVVYILMKKYFVDGGRMSKRNYAFMSFFCLSPIICFFLIVLNIMIPASGTKSKTYAIKGLDVDKGFIINQGDLSYLEHKEVFAELESDDSYSVTSRILPETVYYDTITINYHYGITGLKVFENNEFVKNEPKQ